MTSGWRSPLFFLILAVYLLAGVLFATLTPNWQAPDEPAHYNYIRYLAQQSGFPELVSRCYNQAYLEQLKAQRFAPELSLDAVCYEFHQPPLYYLLATPLFILSNGSLLALRLFSVLLGAGVVALAGSIAQTIFPNWAAISYGTMAFVAFVPMHVAVLASVNNDALAELILAAILLRLMRRLTSVGPSAIPDNIFLGVLLGLGLMTKTTVYIAIPLTLVALWLAARRRGTGEPGSWWVGLIKQAILIFGVALVLALPWYIRNATLYGSGDILGLGRHDAVVVGQPRTAAFVAEVGWGTYLQNFITTTFHSFWGQFGWMAVPMSARAYLALTLLALAAVAGLLFWLRDGRLAESIPSPDALILAALTILLMLLGYLWYNQAFVQFQGRYLFPALIPLGLFFSLGLYEALSPRRAWWLVGGLTLALIWLGFAALATGDLDKWVGLMLGLTVALAIGRAWLAARWPVPAWWLVTGVYAGLALLTLISPFWYVLPYLSP